MNEFSMFINQQSKSSSEFHHIYLCRQEKSAFKISNIKLYVQCQIWNSYNQQTCETQHTGIIDTKAIFFMSRGRLPTMSQKTTSDNNNPIRISSIIYLGIFSTVMFLSKVFNFSQFTKDLQNKSCLKTKYVTSQVAQQSLFRSKMFSYFQMFVCM